MRITGTEERSEESENRSWLRSFAPLSKYTVYKIEIDSRIRSSDEALPFERKKYTTYRRFSEFE